MKNVDVNRRNSTIGVNVVSAIWWAACYKFDAKMNWKRSFHSSFYRIQRWSSWHSSSRKSLNPRSPWRNRKRNGQKRKSKCTNNTCRKWKNSKKNETNYARWFAVVHLLVCRSFGIGSDRWGGENQRTNPRELSSVRTSSRTITSTTNACSNSVASGSVISKMSTQNTEPISLVGRTEN